MSGSRLDPGSASGGSPVGGVGAPGRAQIAERTLRVDRWWLPPLVTFALLAWLVYANVRTFMQRWYCVEDYHYLTPFYSPCVIARVRARSRRLRALGEFTPTPLIPYAALSLPFLLGFRLTCYYYRKAYYRSFWLSPPACAVAEPHAKYTGETRFPLILQNIHRYFFYAARGHLAHQHLRRRSRVPRRRRRLRHRPRQRSILLVNVDRCSGPTRCRATPAGTSSAAGSTHFSKHPVRYWLWTRSRKLNARHMVLAWVTLVSLDRHRLLRHAASPPGRSATCGFFN